MSYFIAYPIHPGSQLTLTAIGTELVVNMPVLQFSVAFEAATLDDRLQWDSAAETFFVQNDEHRFDLSDDLADDLRRAAHNALSHASVYS